jgi:hypothetical protein
MNAAVEPVGALVRYDAMCHAITAAYQVDEVKDIRDKALALERYAAQARNVEAERQACEIRLRAERRAGQLLRETEKAKPGPEPSDRSHRITDPATLSDLGVSKKQSSDWQKLAGVPETDFEDALKSPEKPTTSGIISAHAPPPKRETEDPLKVKALWLWGRLQDFEREGLFSESPADLLAVMSDHMRATTLALAPQVIQWLGGLNDDR